MQGQKDHQHLVVKELMGIVKMSAGTWIRQHLREMNIDYYSMGEEEKRIVLSQMMNQMRQSQQGNQLLGRLQGQLKEQIQSSNFSSTKKNNYLIDCLRQATAFPIIKQRQGLTYNFQSLHGRDIGRELRRVIWSRVFNGDKLRMQFSKWDREVTPYKVQQQLRSTLQKISSQLEITLKENQILIGLRIAEYFLKAHQKLPQKYHFCIVLNLVDLYSFTNVSKVVDVGAVCLGVVQLLQFYNEPTDVRLGRLKKALQIVDGQTLTFIEKNFLSGSEAVRGTRDLLQCFELFRLSASSYYLPVATAQFIIDQLIIRKRCRLDIYILFAIMILIISDEFQEKEIGKINLKQLVQRAKTVVKKEQFVEAYSVIYANIPAFYNGDHLERHPNNRLLAEMLSLERQLREQLPGEEENFVVVSESAARIGQKS